MTKFEIISFIIIVVIPFIFVVWYAHEEIKNQ